MLSVVTHRPNQKKNDTGESKLQDVLNESIYHNCLSRPAIQCYFKDKQITVVKQMQNGVFTDNNIGKY